MPCIFRCDDIRLPEGPERTEGDVFEIADRGGAKEEFALVRAES